MGILGILAAVLGYGLYFVNEEISKWVIGTMYGVASLCFLSLAYLLQAKK
ncbi:hypothetical protein N781_05095 [Pontibacillus halophilus JSM 076056 = DSM 19796]|uniref:Uncharacterized protein n=2 Tax=Pontibacillus TaxID=289201 RepID=A0A0A5GJ39_9BACI|nr:hypothetical protein N781_05095 [Pontibacillus halophilus JSM 076056 = DSM 19796]